MHEPVSSEARRENLAGYYTAVEVMDQQIGRLLDALDAQGIREETLVVFMSDNGMNMGHRGLFGKSQLDAANQTGAFAYRFPETWLPET